jgi:hypothetical protein
MYKGVRALNAEEINLALPELLSSIATSDFSVVRLAV